MHEEIHVKSEEDVIKKCKFCRKQFCGLSALKVHVSSTHCHENEILFKPFRCRKCLKEFTRKDALQKHMVSHLKRSERKMFDCKQCDAWFTLKCNLLKHVRIIHSS